MPSHSHQSPVPPPCPLSLPHRCLSFPTAPAHIWWSSIWTLSLSNFLVSRFSPPTITRRLQRVLSDPSADSVSPLLTALRCSSSLQGRSLRSSAGCSRPCVARHRCTTSGSCSTAPYLHSPLAQCIQSLIQRLFSNISVRMRLAIRQ